MEHTEKERKGKVWLAGAGPGDASLLTLKAARLIEKADVIVYDALISAETLSRIPEKKEVIYVGKHAGDHPVPQEEINRILVREAEKGKQVLRLKGGDPFVFGRGGEELELLIRAGIPFEIVPGVTSAAAVPAYAGIPVTHRDYASSFHVITGHARKGGRVDLDFPALVRLKGTLVFLMGLSAMEFLLNGLTEAGMDPDTPAAVLENGTCAGQRRVTATVGTLKEASDRAGIKTPAIIVVGKVCALSSQMHWAEDRVLGGRQFLVTRPRQSSSSLAERLRDLGAQVIEMPAIRTEPICPNRRLREVLETFGTHADQEWLVFTSPAGADLFFDQLMELGMDLRSLLVRGAEVRIAAIGSGTAAALGKRGLIPDLVPRVYSAAALGEALAETAAEGSRITVARAEKGSEELLPPLLKAGLDVDDIPLYRTLYETHPLLKDRIRELLEQGRIDAVTFTSASTVRGFTGAVECADYTGIRAVCIGEQTAAEAAKYGMQIQVSDQASMDAMVGKIVELFGKDSGQ
ncbi:MAG TPA: uroporphyrinogen-III C-methyltransferase [Candidatus Mediterraneibacter caccavium]|uniref:uroporphyrinogen-III C-methyltransferase n=1 Tax=Candidatus Mediterraneibacter caccavium TaxID=2838661 RepID=A0A9D1VYP8_9FIRM|nr:uroporphyrinogen-III C-methyltransferase [Candidatus Mediterraneibacter caccavium]